MNVLLKIVLVAEWLVTKAAFIYSKIYLEL